MKTIPLTKGYVALVDDEDFDRVNARKWYAVITPWGDVYAKSMLSKKENPSTSRKSYAIHRFILGISDSNIEVDHIDGNTMNNSRNNLRIANSAENSRNRGKNKNNKSGYKGVYFHKNYGKWAALICVNYQKFNLGYFDTPEDAYEAYKIAALELHGDFAKTE